MIMASQAPLATPQGVVSADTCVGQDFLAPTGQFTVDILNPVIEQCADCRRMRTLRNVQKKSTSDDIMLCLISDCPWCAGRLIEYLRAGKKCIEEKEQTPREAVEEFDEMAGISKKPRTS